MSIPSLENRLLRGFIEFNTSPSSLGSPNEVHLAEIAVQAFVEYLEFTLKENCLNAAENDGVCDLLFKHEDCVILHKMLFELTLEERYNGYSNY